MPPETDNPSPRGPLIISTLNVQSESIKESIEIHVIRLFLVLSMELLSMCRNFKIQFSVCFLSARTFSFSSFFPPLTSSLVSGASALSWREEIEKVFIFFLCSNFSEIQMKSNETRNGRLDVVRRKFPNPTRLKNFRDFPKCDSTSSIFLSFLPLISNP